MSYRLLVNDIKNQNIKNIILVFGSETYLIDKAWESLKNTVVTIYPELNYTLLEGQHIKADQLAAACETFPFASERRMVAVRDLYALKASGKSEGEAEDTASSSLELRLFLEQVSNIPDTTCLLLIFYGNVDKRKKLYTEIKKHGSIYEFERVERDEFSTWIKNVIGKSKKKINPKELDHFVHLTGYIDKNSNKSLYDVENELKKLVSFMGTETFVSFDHINTIMPRNAEHDIFKLINACSERKVSDSLRIYGDLLTDGESSLGILALITRQIKNIINVQELYQKGYDNRAMADRLKIHEYTIKLCSKYSDAIKRNKLINAFENCIEAEMKIKSGKMSDRLAIEMLLVNLFE